MTSAPQRRGATALWVLLALTGCSAATGPLLPPDSGVGAQPVSTSLPAVLTSMPAAAVGDDTRAITDRFTTAIWPAVVEYHYHAAQNGPEQLRWLAVIDPELDPAAWSDLREAVGALGKVGPSDSEDAVSGGVDRLELVSSGVTASTPTAATVAACYTFIALTYTAGSGIVPVRTPAAATTDFALIHTDAWYLHAITNRHAVPGC